MSTPRWASSAAARGVTTALFGAAVLLAATGCTPAPHRAPGNALVGTTWVLKSIQSMDDAIGTLAVAEPARFTLRLDADGQASFTLDCNRGTATWQHKAAGDASGSLQFGPIAATRALCSPAHLDERVARDMSFVRGYLLKDGKLYLSLMADAAIYEWEPRRP